MAARIRTTPTSFATGIALSLLLACSGGGRDDSANVTPTVPEVPVPPKPSITLSSDSVVASLLAGAPSVAQEIDVTAGNTTNVSGLAVVDSAGGVPSGWVTASLSSTTAPTKLSVRVSPTLAPGRYDVTLRVTATNADPRIVRVALVVRPRPRLRGPGFQWPDPRGSRPARAVVRRVAAWRPRGRCPVAASSPSTLRGGVNRPRPVKVIDELKVNDLQLFSVGGVKSVKPFR